MLELNHLPKKEGATTLCLLEGYLPAYPTQHLVNSTLLGYTCLKRIKVAMGINI